MLGVTVCTEVIIVLPLQSIEIDGNEYVVSEAEEEYPGYRRLAAAEAYWVLRDWAQRSNLAHVVDLLCSVGAWCSVDPPRSLQACIDGLAARFDDYMPDLVLHRRMSTSVAPELSIVEDALDLVDGRQLMPGPVLYVLDGAAARALASPGR